MQTSFENPDTNLVNDLMALMLQATPCQQVGEAALTFCRASHCEALVEQADMLALCANAGQQPMPLQLVSA